MRSVDRRPICIRRSCNGWIDACESYHGCAAKGVFRGPPEAMGGPIFVDGQRILAYTANAVAIWLAAMNANVSAGPRVPPEPG
jgi:hypothetical protein